MRSVVKFSAPKSLVKSSKRNYHPMVVFSVDIKFFIDYGVPLPQGLVVAIWFFSFSF
jgi:hypothetical protein